MVEQLSNSAMIVERQRREILQLHFDSKLRPMLRELLDAGKAYETETANNQPIEPSEWKQLAAVHNRFLIALAAAQIAITVEP